MGRTFYQSKHAVSKPSKIKIAWKLLHRQFMLIKASVMSVWDQMKLVEEIEKLGEVAPTHMTALLHKLHFLAVEKNPLLAVISLLHSMHCSTK
jgi:hypothetical protein